MCVCCVCVSFLGLLWFKPGQACNRHTGKCQPSSRQGVVCILFFQRRDCLFNPWRLTPCLLRRLSPRSAKKQRIMGLYPSRSWLERHVVAIDLTGCKPQAQDVASQADAIGACSKVNSLVQLQSLSPLAVSLAYGVFAEANPPFCFCLRVLEDQQRGNRAGDFVTNGANERQDLVSWHRPTFFCVFPASTQHFPCFPWQ